MFVSNYWHVCAKKLKEHFFPPFPQNAILLKRGLMSKLHQPYCFSEFKKITNRISFPSKISTNIPDTAIPQKYIIINKR